MRSRRAAVSHLSRQQEGGCVGAIQTKERADVVHKLEHMQVLAVACVHEVRIETSHKRKNHSHLQEQRPAILRFSCKKDFKTKKNYIRQCPTGVSSRLLLCTLMLCTPMRQSKLRTKDYLQRQRLARLVLSTSNPTTWQPAPKTTRRLVGHTAVPHSSCDSP